MIIAAQEAREYQEMIERFEQTERDISEGIKEAALKGDTQISFVFEAGNARGTLIEDLKSLGYNVNFVNDGITKICFLVISW